MLPGYPRFCVEMHSTSPTWGQLNDWLSSVNGISKSLWLKRIFVQPFTVTNDFSVKIKIKQHESPNWFHCCCCNIFGTLLFLYQYPSLDLIQPAYLFSSCFFYLLCISTASGIHIISNYTHCSLSHSSLDCLYLFVMSFS